MDQDMKSSMTTGLLGNPSEAFRITSRNGKFSLFFPLFISYSLLLLANEFVLMSFAFDFVKMIFVVHTNYPQHNDRLHELQARVTRESGIIIGEELVFIVAYCVISLLSAIAAVCAAADTNAKRSFPVIGKIWKRTVITVLYVTFFTALYNILIGFIPVISHGSHASIAFVVGLAFSSLLLSLLALLFSFFSNTIGTLGLVISVVEEGCKGIEALVKGRELIQGRKFQVFLLSLILTAVCEAIFNLLPFNMRGDNHAEEGELIRNLVLINITCLVSLFDCVVYTVFYYDCKKCYGEEVGVKRTMGYSLVPTTVTTQKDIPLMEA